MRLNKALSYPSSVLLRTVGDSIAKSSAGRRRLCVLNYHRISERPDPLLPENPDIQTFRWQMKLLSSCFNVLPLADGVKALRDGELPPRAVCVTFDDGYRSAFDLALPVLREFGIPATVFVTSGLIESGNMWNDEIVESIRRLPHRELDLRDLGLKKYVLRSEVDKRTVVRHLIQSVKYLPGERRAELTRALVHRAGVRDRAHLMLTREMLLFMAAHGIDFGGHSVTHPILSKLDDESARQEIALGKQQLETLLNREVRFFAYPNGKPGIDFDVRHMNMVREAGYRGAFASTCGAISRDDGLFEMPRGLPWDKSPLLFGARILRWLSAGED